MNIIANTRIVPIIKDIAKSPYLSYPQWANGVLFPGMLAL